MQQRKLQSIGGSFNELEELAVVLAKQPKDRHQELVNRYGSDIASRELQRTREEKAQREKEQKENIALLEEKVRVEREHNNKYEAQIRADLAQQNGITI